MSETSGQYGRVELPRILPYIDEDYLAKIKNDSEQLLHMWAVHNETSAVCRALHVSLLRTNIDNSAKHSVLVDTSLDNDANRIASGIRPQAALMLNRQEGVKSVEIVASLSSSADEPNNPFSSVPTKRGLDLVLQRDDWRKPIGEQPRSRFKITRYFPEDDRDFVVVRTKIDQQGFQDMDTGAFFGVKGRRSGYLWLDDVDKDTRRHIDTMVKTPDYAPDCPELKIARKSVQDFLNSEPEDYQAVVDRIYATVDEAGPQPTTSR